ncbi:MAG: ThiF family adenylyltransferase [Clostridia bacterium]|nr:ThiF family adenylyltransferase [Clostridia bacterium]
MEKFDRSKILFGDEKLKNLAQSKVLLVGVGGVGGYVAEILARSGVGNITLVDNDVVDITNINRQIIALINTVGKKKAELMKERIMQINPDCKCTAIVKRFNAESSNEILSDGYDYIIDAIDSVQDKITLIVECKSRGIDIISAMGAGNRCGIPQFDAVDVFSTQNDGLAKKVRSLLKQKGIKEHKVVYCKEIAKKTKGEIGSVAYYPAMCGCVLAAVVIDKLSGKAE